MTVTGAIDVSISMSIHVGDDATETDDLSPTEYGIHCRLRRALWRRGGDLDGDMSRLRRLVGSQTDADAAALESVVARLWKTIDGGTIVHARTMAEIERMRRLKTKRADAGRTGGQASAKQRSSKGQPKAAAEPNPPTPPPPPTPDPTPTPTPTPTDPEVCAEPAADGPAAPHTEPALLVFPCAGKVKTWNLTESIRTELAEAFPGVDVLAVARRALEWCRSNPTKIKTAKRMRAWIGTTWCGGDQDRGPRGGQPARDIRVGRARAEDFKHDQIGELHP